MTRDPYFSYICDLAMKRKKEDYSKLLATLHSYPFEYILDLDENRETDGLELRVEYFRAHPHFKYELETMYKERPCSVLEMMIALAKRCYDTVLDPGDGKERVDELFFLMLSNMDLIDCKNDNFNYAKVNHNVMRMMNRDYTRDGNGGLFYIPNIKEDMRQVEIWYQAMWYIDSIYN